VKSVSMRDLQQYPLLLLDRTTALRQLIEETAKEQGVVLNTRYQFTQAQTLISMSAYGLGVALLPQVAIPESLPPSLRVVPIIDPPLSRQLAIITLRGHSLSPAAARLVPLFQTAEH
jgi:DNA-binding transcriptional LysR family regulator